MLVLVMLGRAEAAASRGFGRHAKCRLSKTTAHDCIVAWVFERIVCGVNLLRTVVKETIMPDSEWGLCKDCKWWQIEPGAKLANTVMGLCIDEELQDFRLRVSGNSGCNRF